MIRHAIFVVLAWSISCTGHESTRTLPVTVDTGTQSRDGQVPAADASPSAGDDSDSPPPRETEHSRQARDWHIGIVDRPRPAALVAVLQSVRTARHDTYDRVVFEFGPGLPGYHIEYVDRPVRHCGSGEPVAITGDAWLSVQFVPAQAHTETGAPTITERNRVLDLPNMRQVVSTCDFEADVTWVIGVDSPNRYRVLELDGPPRIVVDIAHR